MSINISSLIKRLEKHPYLLTRLEAMLEVAENTTGEYELADDAEEKLFIEVRKLGNEMLQNWAENQIQDKSEKVLERKEAIRHSKKNFTGTLDLEK